LRFDLDDGARVQLRPSGTEPKLKVYGEVVGPSDAAGGADGLHELLADARMLLEAG
jgi:phosphomannomutase